MGNKRDNGPPKGLIRAFLIGIPLIFISGVVLSGQCNVISSSQPKESVEVVSSLTASSIKSSTESTISTTTTTNTSDFELAKRESLGFFNDIPISHMDQDER